jgi:hypothetical protein
MESYDTVTLSRLVVCVSIPERLGTRVMEVCVSIPERLGTRVMEGSAEYFFNTHAHVNKLHRNRITESLCIGTFP